MLSEHFVASLASVKSSSTAVKDASVFVFEAQPLPAPRAVFKKSATAANSLAVTPSHVFAAQADKAVVHVYTRGAATKGGSQEATVPFPERVTCIALACDDTVLVLGTENGRLFLWETHTGRLVISSQAHLQPVTALAVDPSSNFLLSGSADSSIHVWSLPGLLSFSSIELQSPLHTLTGHRGAITSLVTGHSSSFCNIAVSAAKDNSVIIWDYHTASLLRTVLLPSTPLSLSLDAADRAVYTTYDDGSVQMLDFYSAAFAIDEDRVIDHPFYAPADSTSSMPVQPPPTTRWAPPSADVGAALSSTLSYDACTLYTGHESGKILTWDIPLARYSAIFAPSPLPGAVTNLLPLPITVFGKDSSEGRSIKIHAVVKPRHGAFDSKDQDTAVPANYSISAQLASNLDTTRFSAAQSADPSASLFLDALTHPTFPSSLLSSSLAELSSWTASSAPATSSAAAPTTASATEPVAAADSADFMSLDTPTDTKPPSLEDKNKRLEQEVAALRRVQRAALKEMEGLRKEKVQLERALARKEGKDVEKAREAERSWEN